VYRLGSNLILIVLLLCIGTICAAQVPPTPDELLNDLACGSCHEGISVESDILDKAADLSHNVEKTGHQSGTEHGD